MKTTSSHIVRYIVCLNLIFSGLAAGCGEDTPAEEEIEYLVPGAWVVIPAGSFTMGSPDTEQCRYPEEDLHQVTLTHDFEIMSSEVSQGQYQALMGTNPAYFTACGTDCPVEQVKWKHAVAYCNALSVQAELTACYTCTTADEITTCVTAPEYSGINIYDCPGYRLPTEAEWEYAYRAGTTSPYYNGVNDANVCGTCRNDGVSNQIAWTCGNSAVSYAGCHDLSEYEGPICAGPHPSAQKAANAWHLYDMAGNVWEFCHDRWQETLGTEAATDPWGSDTETDIMVRGGSWDNVASSSRAALRNFFSTDFNFYRLGFRVVRTR